MIDPQYYQEALDSQSACNLSGIVFSFARAMEAICDEARANSEGTEWKNHHAICKLFAEQISHLTLDKDYVEAVREAKAAVEDQKK
jgi:hypothetical protein